MAPLSKAPRAARYPRPVLVLLPPSEGKTEPRFRPSSRPRCAEFAGPDAHAAPHPRRARPRVRGQRDPGRQTAGPRPDATGRAGPQRRPPQRPDGTRRRRLHRRSVRGMGSGRACRSPDATFADKHVATASALFGVVRAGDLIPAYRLSAGVELPRLGSVATLWRKPLGPALDELADGGLLIDLRSGAYVNLHKPTGELAARTATIRVLSEVNGVAQGGQPLQQGHQGRDRARHLREPHRSGDARRLGRRPARSRLEDRTGRPRLDVVI